MKQLSANPLTDALSQTIGQQVQSKLPTQGEVIQAYLGAIVAFWVVGGITLYFVDSLRSRKR